MHRRWTPWEDLLVAQVEVTAKITVQTGAGSSEGSKQDEGKESPEPNTDIKIPRSPKDYPPGPRTSFLFVVNELHVHPNVRIVPNERGVETPPLAPSQFTHETAGRVFRWTDGVITRAHEYFWMRDNTSHLTPTTRSIRLGPAGGIFCVSDAEIDEEIGIENENENNENNENNNNGNNNNESNESRQARRFSLPRTEMPRYSQFTIFHSFGPIPVSYVDDDPICTRVLSENYDPRTHPYCRRLQPMNFRPPEVGITEIAAFGGFPYVSGFGRISWMPSLVPEVHRNTNWRIGPSRGLGGLIAVIIGQMALTQPVGKTDAPFVRQWWHERVWLGRRLRSTVTRSGQVRVVVVHVALDDKENREGSTREALDDISASVLVKERVRELPNLN